MNTQCPFESSSRRSLKTAASKLITATLAVIAICLLSNNSAQAQEFKKTTDCRSVSVQEVSTTVLETPQTQSTPGYRGGLNYFDGGGFMYSMIGNLLSSMYSYTTPSAAITDPQQTLEYESATAQTGPGTAPCRVASTSTGTR